MKYLINKEFFKKNLVKQGYKSIFDFSKKASINRATLLTYLAGKEVFSGAFIEIADKLGVDPLELLVPYSEFADKDIVDINEIRPIVGALAKADPSIAIILLGSRAKGTQKKYSDWDIGITCGAKSLSGIEYLKLKNVADELSENLARNFDLVNLDCAPYWFLNSISYEPIFLDGNNESYLFFKGVLCGIRKREKAE